MGYNLNDLASKLRALGYELNSLMESTQYEEYDDLSGLSDIDYKDIEQRFLIRACLKNIFDCAISTK